MSGQILVVSFQGQGHVLPCIELCKRLSASLPYTITLVLPSHVASSTIPSPLFQIAELTPDPPSLSPDADPPQHHRHFDPHGDKTMVRPFTDLLSSLSNSPNPPICAIVDVMLNWPSEACKKFNVPVVSFFTSGACSAAMIHAFWTAGYQDLKPGEFRTLPGLPQDMTVSLADVMSMPQPPPDAPDGHETPAGQKWPRMPPGPPPAGGGKHRWISQTEESIAVMINTCDDLEQPFIEYVAKELGKPVWGVGPLLPQQYWRSADSVVHDHDMRSKRDTNVSEDKVTEWLESKPFGSVIYVAFGTEVGPTSDELLELALALAESNRPFIWALQDRSGGSSFPGPPGGPMGFRGPPGSDAQQKFVLPEGIEKSIQGRGLIIRGWAPQLLILSHPSTGAFISHCGWNSTVEALVRGVPILAWPIRGDQYYNAKLVVNHLKVGFIIKADRSQTDPVKKEDIIQGIEKLMPNEESRKQARTIRSMFISGFPASSIASLYAFKDFIMHKDLLK